MRLSHWVRIFTFTSAFVFIPKLRAGENVGAEIDAPSLFSFFEHKPSGALVLPFLERIATTHETAEDFYNIKTVFIPAILKANQQTISKLEKDVASLSKDSKKQASRQHALTLAKKLESLVQKWSRLEHGVGHGAVIEIAEDATNFLAESQDSELSAQWIAANRLAGFTNSLSTHATSYGIDLQAAAKLSPRGPWMLYGQNQGTDHHGKKIDLWEIHRHMGASNQLVKVATWSNLIGTFFMLPLHYGKDSLMAGNFSKAMEEVLEHPEEIGALRLYQDVENEFVEALRGLFWVGVLTHHGELSLAAGASTKWLGELSAASRRLRKFIQLHPQGTLYLYTFQNSLAVPLFFLDFSEGYLGTLSEQWESLQKKTPASGEFYSEALGMALSSVLPYMAALQLYIYGFGKEVHPGLENSLARYALNTFQYTTYAAVQSYFHAKLLSNMILDLSEKVLGEIAEGTKTLASNGLAIGSIYATYLLYEGRFGEGPKAFAQNNIPLLTKVLLSENLASGIIGAAIGDHHFKVFTDLPAYLWNQMPSIYSEKSVQGEL